MKEPIVAAAAALFRERGFAATSMQEIADAVGLTRPALYYHFRNKEEILESLVEEITLKSIRKTLLIDAAHSTDPGEKLRTIVTAYALWILRHPQHFAVLSRDEQDLPQRARDIQRQGRRELLQAFSHVIRAGIDAGRFRVVDPTVTTLSIFGMCNWTIQWFKPEGRLSEEQVAKDIADLAVSMIQRPLLSKEATHDDVRSWLAVLKDDISHLEHSLLRTAKSG
ncbi:TetR/AcrR family transcriptional regulator [Sphingomonas sp.]|uniref:TetR/AcrR family transcriptional regulator n=1 Tax=Sphingomonas sp. TaxID=28214 RepID=UPI0025EB3773|nr:TetR/AcrR family transcriptional regulator [Sphingomonas sp.]MBV9529232.1 TetR family transcriptional regulator [Sphingomonas sp.]